MEYPQTSTISYDVFGAKMTVDTRTDGSSAKHLTTCQKCQCACHLCRGRIAPTGEEILSKVATENILETLLAA